MTDAGARKWLAAFFLAGVGLGAWLLAALESDAAKVLSPLFLVVVPLLVTLSGAGLRSLFGARTHPLLSIRRKYGRNVEDVVTMGWCALAGLVTGIGCAALVPEQLPLVRAALVFSTPVGASIAAFTAFGSRWTALRRCYAGLVWGLWFPISLAVSWWIAVVAIGNFAARYFTFDGPGMAFDLIIGAAFLIALCVSAFLATIAHGRVTGEPLLAFSSTGTGRTWRQVSVILARAGFRQSSGAWIGALGRGEACITEKRGRLQVQMSGFRPDVTLRAGVPGPKSVLDTGDDVFDGQIAVAGDPARCFAAFIPEARQKLLRVLERFPILHLESGQLVAEGEIHASRLLDALRELAAACEALGEPGHEGERILRILRTDPSPRVRAHALDHLLKERVDVPDEAAWEALADLPGPEVTLAAAYQLGAEGGPHLERLLGPASSERLRIMAIQAIAARCLEPTWHAAAARGLADPSPDIRVEVIRQMRSRWVAGFDELAVRAVGDADAPVRIEAIGLIEHRGLAAQQSVLYPRLADNDVRVKRAAITALGSIASMDAIEKLVPLRALGGEIGRAAGDAIKEIQARIPAGGFGQLSLSGEHEKAGALSAATESGALTIAAAQAGSVTLATDDEKTPDPASPSLAPIAPALAASRKIPG